VGVIVHPDGFINGVAYHELTGSGSMVFTQDGVEATRIFKIDWNDRPDFERGLRGWSEQIGEVWVHIGRASFPDFPSLKVTRVTIEGLGQMVHSAGIAGMTGYENAKVTVTYERPPYDEEEESPGEVYISLELDFQMEFMDQGVQNFSWKSDGKPVEQNVGQLLTTKVYKLTLWRVWDMDSLSNAISTCQGKVNDDTFYGAAAGYVLFLGATSRREIRTNGPQPWNVTLTFAERSQNWNYAWRPDATPAAWEELDPHPYADGDLTTLFL
jgi:hypothetical protein